MASNLAPMTCIGNCSERPRKGLHFVNKQSDRCCDRHTSGASPRTYHGTDVRAALDEWGGFNGNSEAVRISMDLVGQLVEATGDVVETFHIDKYVAVRFRDVADKIGLYINRKNLDGVVPVPGSHPHEKGYHRIELVDSGGTSSGPPASPPRSMCACGAQLPIVPGEFCDVCGCALTR